MTAPVQPLFTNDPLAAGTTPIRGVHVSEIRHYINTLRQRYSLSAFVWTEQPIVAGATTIKAAHVVELRTALDGAYVAAGRTTPSYAAAITAGTVMTAEHIREIRSAILAIY